MFPRPTPCAFLVVACVAIATTAARAQPSPARVGIEGGVVAATASTAIPITAGSPECGEFTGAKTLGGFGGARIALPGLFDGLGAIVRVGYLASLTTSATDPIDPLLVYVERLDSMVEIGREYQLELREQRVEASFLFSLPLGAGFTIAAGPWFGARASSSVVQREKITQTVARIDAGYTFDSGRTERPLAQPTDINPGVVVGGISFAASYALSLGGRFSVEPTLSVDLDPTSTVADLPWAELRAMLTLPVTYDLGTSVDTIPLAVAEPVVTPRAIARDSLSAQVAIVALGDRGEAIPTARVTVYETVRRTRVGFDPWVEFAGNSAALPTRYADRTVASRFAPDSLALVAADALGRRALDLVGWRWRRRARAWVALAPSTAPDEPSWLGFARAEAVREYLESVWGIERPRVEIRPLATRRARLRGVSRRVELVGETRELTAPFVAELPERTIDPPTVQLLPDIVATAGVASAEVVIEHDGRPVARYSSVDPPDSAVSWQITPDRIGTASQLTVELRVTDSSGQHAVAHARLPIGLDRLQRIVETTTHAGDPARRMLVTLFDGAPLSARNRAALDELASAIGSGTVVIVEGSDDVRAEFSAMLARRGVAGVSVRAGRVDARGVSAGAVRILVERSRR
jgi:hypothetical protein